MVPESKEEGEKVRRNERGRRGTRRARKTLPGSIGWKIEGVAEPATQFQQGHSIFPSFFVAEFGAPAFMFVMKLMGSCLHWSAGLGINS